jgi:hypothetical protein
MNTTHDQLIDPQQVVSNDGYPGDELEKHRGIVQEYLLSGVLLCGKQDLVYVQVEAWADGINDDKSKEVEEEIVLIESGAPVESFKTIIRECENKCGKESCSRVLPLKQEHH